MHRWTRWVGTAAVGVVLLAACGDESGEPAEGGAPEAPEEADMPVDEDLASTAANGLLASARYEFGVDISFPGPPANEGGPPGDELAMSGTGVVDLNLAAWYMNIDASTVLDAVGAPPDTDPTLEVRYFDGVYKVTSEVIGLLNEAGETTVTAEDVRDFTSTTQGLPSVGLGAFNSALAANPVAAVARTTSVPFQQATSSGATIVELKAFLSLDVTPRIDDDVVVTPERIEASMRNMSQAWVGDVDLDPISEGVVLETVMRVDPDGGVVIDVRQRLEYRDAIDVLSDQLDDAESLDGAFLETLLEIEQDDSGSEIPTGPAGVPIIDIPWLIGSSGGG